MISWPLLAAFLAGCGIALALEAWLLRRAQAGRTRAAIFGGLAMVSFVCAVLAWQLTKQPPPGQAPLSLASITAVTSTEPIIPPLPAPQVHSLSRQSNTVVTPQPSSPQPIRLQIPALLVDEAIQPVPLRDGRWDVSELGGQVGLLATTGQSPSDALAMVFAGHMTFPNANLLQTGAFADLQYATYGTEIVVHTAAESLIYEVAEISRLAPEAVDRLYLADSDSILLITCTDWAEPEGIYANRLLIRAQAVASSKTDEVSDSVQ